MRARSRWWRAIPPTRSRWRRCGARPPSPADTGPTQVRRAPTRVDEDARTPIPEVMRAADERQHQVLSQAIGLLVDLAETSLAGTSHARELGRWARRVAREMGLA